MAVAMPRFRDHPRAPAVYVCAALSLLPFLFPRAGAADPLADILEKLGTFGAQRQERGEEAEAFSAAADLLASLQEQRAKMQEDREQRRKMRTERQQEQETLLDEEDKPLPTEPEPSERPTLDEANSSEPPPKPEFRSYESEAGGHEKPRFEDPFEHIVKGFMGSTERLKQDRDRKRAELKESEAELKESQRLVRDLEQRLHAAQAKTQKLEIEVKARKVAKQEAEKAVLRAYTDIAENVGRTAEQAMGRLGKSQSHAGDAGEGSGREDGFERIEPQPFAEAVLWGERHYKGQKHTLRCCEYYDLSSLRSPVSIRSITLPKGVHAILYLSGSRFKSDSSSGSPGSVELFGSVAELDGMISFTLGCCRAIQLISGIQHSVDSSVVLYSEEGFEGTREAFLPGDYELRRPMKVASVRVPAGLKATFYAAPKFGDGSFISAFRQDTGKFPHQETSTSEEVQPRLPVASMKVRRIQDSDLHGLFVYPEEDFEGRPQFFESGQHYIYPESWPDVKSAKPTNSTFTRLFSEQGLKTVREPDSKLDTKFARPRAIEVAAICDPTDFCGEHGKCVAPQRCECEGSYSGPWCHLQTPDESSAIICERNAIVVGETLPCALIPRRYNQACNATSLFMQVQLGKKAQESATLLGSPIIAAERHLAGGPQERNRFPFDVVFNSTGVFAKPFEFLVFGKAQAGSFIPQLRVLERCDSAGTSASMQCGRQGEEPEAMLNCTFSLHREGRQLRCPRQALRVLLPEGQRPTEALEIHDDGEADQEHFSFFFDPAQLKTATAAQDMARFTVEVRHGPAWTVPSLKLEVQAPLAAADASSSLATAKGLLRLGNLAQALDVLATCLAARPCAALRATVLMQLGRLEDAEAVFATLGAEGEGPRQKLRALLAAVAQADATAASDPEGALLLLGSTVDAAPLSSDLRLRRANLALLAGRFDVALEEARAALRLERSMQASDASPGAGAAALATLGRGLLALGHGEAAKHNFRGCAQLQENLPPVEEATECSALAEAAATLERDMQALDSSLQAERWPEALDAAGKFLMEHSARWPRFNDSLWGFRAAAAQCLAGQALNATDATPMLQACGRVVRAPDFMRERIDSPLLLRCQVALAEALERQHSVNEALEAVEAAESLLGDTPLDDMAAVVRLLLERLRNAQREAGEGEKSEQSDNSTGSKPKRPEPADFYEVLGLPKNASASEIKHAYRQLALKYHPDKNTDPEAIQMFLDIQKAYEVLSDTTLRRRYDAGQTDVGDEAGNKNMKPMKFRVVERDRKRGIAKVWWYDPNTGEEGFMEMEIEKEESESSRAASMTRPLHEHCCLPEPGDNDEL